MEHNLILRVVARGLIPLILLFALYVQFHGDYGPGGGFQAGVIFAAGFILHALVFGTDRTKKILHPALLETLAALGVILYTTLGLLCLIRGGEFLNYNVLLSDPIGGQHLGILIIEFGVGLTVASTMILLFYIFSRPWS